MAAPPKWLISPGSNNTAVPDGPFGHWSYHEHIYPSGIGGCTERDGPPGGIESG